MTPSGCRSACLTVRAVRAAGRESLARRGPRTRDFVRAHRSLTPGGHSASARRTRDGRRRVRGDRIAAERSRVTSRTARRNLPVRVGARVSALLGRQLEEYDVSRRRENCEPVELGGLKLLRLGALSERAPSVDRSADEDCYRRSCRRDLPPWYRPCESWGAGFLPVAWVSLWGAESQCSVFPGLLPTASRCAARRTFWAAGERVAGGSRDTAGTSSGIARPSERARGAQL